MKTKVASIASTKDQDLVPALKREGSPVITKAHMLTITTEDDKEAATVVLSKLNKVLDRSTEDRERITKPLNAALKEVRAKYKPLDTILEEAITIVRRKLSVYQTEAKRLADIEAAKIASRVAPGRGHLSPETAVAKIASLDTPAARTETDVGTLKFRTDRVLKITDQSLVYIYVTKTHDFSFMDINESKLLAALKRNEPIPGARIEEVQTPINSR